MKIMNTTELNNNYNIQEVIERVLGSSINPKKKIDCPICGKNDASVNVNKNVFNCWSGGCTEGGARPYRFLDVYYRKVEGLTDFKEIYKNIDKLLGTSLYKEFTPSEARPKKKDQYTRTYKVDKYCSEIELDFFNDVLKEKRVLLKAGTGFGKSHMLAEGAKTFYNCRALDVDKVIFATARGSIVEEIGERGYEKFYKNDVQLPYQPFIATTTHKAPLLVQQLEETATTLQDGSIQWEDPKDYLLIVDECHLLLTSRNIVVKEHKDLRHLKQLIDRAKYVIFTSANTEHFYNACKDIYDIKSYINIERHSPLYNLERLEIKRTKNDRDTRNKILIEDIIRENKNGNKVFLVHNNIKDLQHIKSVLDVEGVLTNVLYSANKTSEEVYKDYIALIKKSVLNCDVTLCTSVVDTGVNIHENKVTTMLVQDQTAFDDVTTIQTFARVRVNSNGFHGNKGILYLTDIKERLEKHDKLHAIDNYLKYYKEQATTAARSFNEHMFNNYDIESYEAYKDVWNLLRGNDMYSNIRHLLALECEGDYNENPTMLTDDVAIYDRGRRSYLTNNYFNDDFIKTVAEEINTKEIVFTKDLREKEEKEKKQDGETFQDVLIKFMDDPEYHQIIMDRYIKEIKEEEEPFYIGYLKTDYTSKFNKLDKRIKAFCNMIRRTRVQASELGYITAMYEAHALLTSKELKLQIQSIEYPIYNLMYKDPHSYEGLGDSEYYLLRDSFEKAVFNRNTLSNRAVEMFTIQRLLNQGTSNKPKYYYDKKTKEVKTMTKDKPVNMEKEIMESYKLINTTYSISEKNYLSFL